MKHYDVSRDDGMVLDSEGTIWIYSPVAERWDYLSTSGVPSGWDSREDLPEEYEPYVRLSDPAQGIILKGLLA